MSFHRLSNAAWRNGGLGAAASVVILSELDPRRTTRNNVIQRNDKDDKDSFQTNPTRLSPIFQPSMTYSQPLSSSSPFWSRGNKHNMESGGGGGTNPRTNKARLARHRTVRMMEDTSTKKSLQSRYEVDWEHPLGEGAFGAVYRAMDRDSGEAVAVKKITKEYTDDRGFQREFDALNHVRRAGGHPNICRLRENFEQGGHYYLALDLVSGGEMFDHLVQLGSYSEADASRLIREVASALAFLHGIDVVHGDLKPENLMLSTSNPSDAVIKVVDFGSSQVQRERHSTGVVGNTLAYCPPEVLGKRNRKKYMEASLDMWSLGVILYIMLTGFHPFDLSGQSTDQEIMKRILAKEAPPLRGADLTAHLSESSLDLIESLLNWNPKKRLTALQMLEHPWVRGETARQDKMADSAKKLKMFRPFKSGLEATVFANIISWASDEEANTHDNDAAKKASLIERAFHTLDPQRKGFITTKDLHKLSGSSRLQPAEHDPAAAADSSLSLSNFEDLLSENMRNKYFPKGHVVYREGDIGNHMYMINSGTIEVSTKDGVTTRRTQGDFFGEGALLDKRKVRSGSIKCVTPVHAIEISREYVEKYLAASSDLGLKMTLRETDKSRRRNRAKTILRLSNKIVPLEVHKGDVLYHVGEEGKDLYIMEEGVVDVRVDDHTVFTIRHPGNLCGEHALITGRLRNTSAVCVSDTCKLQVMRGRDFRALLRHSSNLKESLRDLCLRREFQKAIVFKTKRPFPSDPKDLRRAFEAADEDSSGKISLENVRTMLKRYDPTIPEKDLVDTINSLDLDESGAVSFEEFQRIFGIDEAQATSM